MKTKLLTNFDTASRAILSFLHKRMGFNLWMITRTEGDDLLIRAASALQSAARPHDVVARLSGDEFGILSAECDRTGGEAILKRIRAIFSDSNISASISLAMRDPEIGLKGACEKADRLMHEEKSSTSHH